MSRIEELRATLQAGRTLTDDLLAIDKVLAETAYLNDEIEQLRQALNDLAWIATDPKWGDGREHWGDCLVTIRCTCAPLRNLSRRWRDVKGCDTCHDTTVIGDPLGPDMGQWDIVSCPDCT